MDKKLLRIGIMVFLFLLSSSIVMADFVNVPASAFKTQEEDGEIHLSSYGDYVYKPTIAASNYLYAPVYLPDGAIIKHIRLQYLDTDGDYDLTVELYRTNIFNGAYDPIFSCESTGDIAVIRTKADLTCSPSDSYRKVHNNVCTYCIRASFGAAGIGLRLYGVTICYE